METALFTTAAASKISRNVSASDAVISNADKNTLALWRPSGRCADKQ